MCITVTPTSLMAGRTNDVEVCCDSFLGRPRGTWALEGDSGAMSGGSSPAGHIVPGVIGRGDVIDPDTIRPPGPGEDNPYGFCTKFSVSVPVTATLFLVRGTCYDANTGEFICTELKIIPVYLDTSPGGDGPPPPPNAGIPEPFRGAEATPAVANDPAAWE